jgi:SPP1 gp7 family putative phage head morphogenesis protein
MGFLDWLTKKNSISEPDAVPKALDARITPIGNLDPVCPYCNYKFDKMPLKKKKCPNCNNFVRSRTRPFDNKKVLIKEEQMEELENQWWIKNEQSGGIILGAPPEIRRQEAQKLANQIDMNKGEYEGISHEDLKQIRNIIAKGIREEKSTGEVSREIVQQFNIDKERANRLAHTETTEAISTLTIQNYKQSGIKNVEILVALDGQSCEKCLSYNLKIFPIDKAPKIPVHEGCRCCYAPAINKPVKD